MSWTWSLTPLNRTLSLGLAWAAQGSGRGWDWSKPTSTHLCALSSGTVPLAVSKPAGTHLHALRSGTMPLAVQHVCLGVASMLLGRAWHGGIVESGRAVQWCPGTVNTQMAFPVVSKTLNL